MKVLLQLFWNFLLVGFFGAGSAWMALPLLYDRLVAANHWLTPGQLTGLLAFSRLLPGQPEVGLATVVGYGRAAAAGGFWWGLLGVAVAVGAVGAASCVCMLPALRLLGRGGEHPVARGVLQALRPVTFGLMCSFFILLCNADNFGSPGHLPWDFGVSVFLFASTFVGVHYFRFHPVFMLLLCGLAGILLF